MKRIVGLLVVLWGVSIALLYTGGLVLADDTNEDQMFSGGDTVVSQDQVVNNNTGNELQEKHLGFSGQINAQLGNTHFSPTDWTPPGSSEQDIIQDQVTGDFFTDIRLKDGIKGFLSFEVNDPPLSSTSTQNTTVDEFFVDTNLNNKVYFRIGKQYLKWGQGYFWTPTDFIDTARKNFFNMDQVMPGTFGAKIQIPSGVKQNLYFFIGGDNSQTVNEDLSLSGKYEFLVKNTEMSFSASVLKARSPIYGFEINGRIFKQLDYRGEISLTDGSNYSYLDYQTLDTVYGSSGLVPCSSFGFTKYWTVKDIKDQISLTTEFYYNGAGYDQNIIQRIAESGNTAVKDSYFNILNNQPDYFQLNMYQPFLNSKYYAALFGSVQDFIIPEITFNLNGIMNMVDSSAVVTAGISYVPKVIDMEIDFNIYDYLGAPNTEATFSGNRWSLNLQTKISF